MDPGSAVLFDLCRSRPGAQGFDFRLRVSRGCRDDWDVVPSGRDGWSFLDPNPAGYLSGCDRVDQYVCRAVVQ